MPEAEAELKVELCRRTVRVPLRPGEGLGGLQTRVAEAFGLTAPFDLLGPAGVPLRTDEDAVGAAAAAMETASSGSGAEGAPSLRVDTREDALLDLERAHEESGALRWALLREVLAGFRRQLAEAALGKAELQHCNAKLDERLARERSSREAGDAAVLADLQALGVKLGGDICQVRLEARSSVDAAVADLSQRLEVLSKSQAEEWHNDIEALAKALRDDIEVRRRAGDEALREIADLRLALERETEARAAASAQAVAAAEALGAELEAERAARLALEVKNAEAEAGACSRQSEERVRLDGLLEDVAKSIENVRSGVAAGKDAVADVSTTAAKHAEDMVRALEAKLMAHEANVETSFMQLPALEAKLKACIIDEAEARKTDTISGVQALEEVVCQLRQEENARKAFEERTLTASKEIVAAADEDRRMRAADAAERDRAQAEIAAKLEVEEGIRESAVLGLRTECEALRHAVDDERQRREAADTSLAEAEATARNQALGETRRWQAIQMEEQRGWAKLLVERMSSEERVEREAAVAEMRRIQEEISSARCEKLREELVRRMDDTSAEQERKLLASARREDLARVEDMVKSSGIEVKAALASHGEFAEALAAEHRKLCDRHLLGLADEAKNREVLESSIKALERDMQKIAGYMPLLFCPNAAFR
eukprot:gnl/TRDRNA2_/TRDRNA2_188549_c0_seq1.p1 gnl/TRDRNA2_/TRDRNA2_188549_c0~~gnl/TRDRNA2_/TRDRNA2_188549_c0_seq1.p1  ORF type:complete len:661 (-),score=191.75 gnl/TRDRNA2_/TRDRNA2_188549_c0_seq1:81-2063(-)